MQKIKIDIITSNNEENKQDAVRPTTATSKLKDTIWDWYNAKGIELLIILRRK